MEFQVWREGLQGEEGMLLLDFAKAYDRVDHKYLDRVLRRMGIPTKVRGVIQDLYCQAKFRVQTTEGVTEARAHASGVRQGDPISSFLFVLALEPLMCWLRDTLVGIEREGVTKKVSAYADDMLLFARDGEDADFAKEGIGWYEKASGAELRPDKSWVVGSTVVPGFRVWHPGEHIKYLGYAVGRDGMERQVSKMVGALNKWRWKSLSMIGRVNVMNSYGLSMLTYHMCIHPYTKELSRKISQITRWFLFFGNEKMDPARRYAGTMSSGKLLAMGLLDWGMQWRALRAVTVMKVVRDTGSKIGEIARRRLESMKEKRGWLVSPLWAYNTRWRGVDKDGVLGSWLAEAGGGLGYTHFIPFRLVTWRACGQ